MDNAENIAEVRKKLATKGWSQEEIDEVCPTMRAPAGMDDGGGDMDPMTAARIVKFLVSKLTPDDRAELDEMLGKEAPDLAQDIKNGSLAMDRAPTFVRRQISTLAARGQAARLAEAEADFVARFPDAARLKR